MDFSCYGSYFTGFGPTRVFEWIMVLVMGFALFRGNSSRAFVAFTLLWVFGIGGFFMGRHLADEAAKNAIDPVQEGIFLRVSHCHASMELLAPIVMTVVFVALYFAVRKR